MSMNKTPVLASMEEACRAVQIELINIGTK